MNEQHGWTIWLTGLPASGKTTLAHAIQSKLRQHGIVATVLDSDAMRPLLSPASDYTARGRAEFYQRLTDLAAHLTSDGVNVIIAATANRRSYRQHAREQLHPFAEVWVRCALDVCRARDPKQLYHQAESGIIRDLPGVDETYEPPEAAAIVVDTDQQPPEAAADAVIAGLPWLRHLLLEQFDS